MLLMRLPVIKSQIVHDASIGPGATKAFLLTTERLEKLVPVLTLFTIFVVNFFSFLFNSALCKYYTMSTI